MSGLISAEELRRIAEQKEAAKAAEAMARMKHAEEEKAQQREMFMARKVTPEAVERLMTRIRRAAEDGRDELLLGQFPSDWCTDRGRAINNGDANWPTTLTGMAKEVYDYFEKELKPHGYRCRMTIVNFPGGMPGDVGAYLSW